ncbi:hypothetical protein H2136_05865 [Aeromonas hydrophila]|uniref:Uncharacterized protein n=1 Tax=Aeromonas hydrophila TaxID=644 RepID=A0A926FN76_AERHY|nr:hypothetical protein [Aeromonas hydrophila]
MFKQKTGLTLPVPGTQPAAGAGRGAGGISRDAAGACSSQAPAGLLRIRSRQKGRIVIQCATMV